MRATAAVAAVILVAACAAAQPAGCTPELAAIPTSTFPVVQQYNGLATFTYVANLCAPSPAVAAGCISANSPAYFQKLLGTPPNTTCDTLFPTVKVPWQVANGVATAVFFSTNNSPRNLHVKITCGKTAALQAEGNMIVVENNQFDFYLNLTSSHMCGAPAGAIVETTCAGVGVGGACTKRSLAAECTANSNGGSTLRFCAGSELRVQQFAGTASCAGVPEASTAVPVGKFFYNPGTDTSFAITTCDQ
jgi:hypothetical protein